MSTSKRHHFIPVFYLKQFTDNAGFFFIYDVKKGSFKNNGKRFAPSTHFYEHHGNTTFFNLEQSDFIERDYKKYDDQISSILRKIANSESNEDYKLSPNE